MLYHRSPFACLALLLISFGLNAAEPTEEGFVPLFNGRNFNGWTNVNCAPETWSISNGVIQCTGIPTGALRTLRQYENFILELEWRHLRSAGNSGVFIWASPISAPGVPFLRAIEVQVLDHGYGQSEWYTTHGDVFPIHGSTMEPHGRHNGMRSFPSENRSKGSPEWNHYRITGSNGVLRLSVNGKEVSGGSNCNWRKGYLGLESEGAPVEFRNLRLKELPGGNATSEQTAPLAQGHQPLYNGLDLRGWKTAAGSGDRWKAADWQLQLKDNRGQKGEVLFSEGSFADFELIVDFRVPDQPDFTEPFGGVHLRGSTSPALVLGGINGAVALGSEKLKPKTWYRATLSVSDDKFSVKLGDSLIAENIPLPKGAPLNGSIGLADFGHAMSYANIYVLPTPRPR